MMRADATQIAPGVHHVPIGRGLSGTNVYFVQSGPAWVLIDAAWVNRGKVIAAIAEELYGRGTRPAAIVLTHIHPDHAGSALELAHLWDLPVHVHPAEMPMAAGRYLPEYGNPLDRWLVAPMLRLMPRRRLEAMQSRASIEQITQPFDPAHLPALPDWQGVPTPGHTPGHVAFFRPGDRVLITGDAVLTMNLNSVGDLLLNRCRVSGPPFISTWNWPAAKRSVRVLAGLKPSVVAGGHGRPISGPGTAALLSSFADRFAPRAPAPIPTGAQ